MMKIAVIIPLFNEECIVNKLYSRIADVINRLEYTCSLIFIDDGSSDATTDLLRNLQSEDSRVVILTLSRNWGQQCAYNAGIDYSDDDAVILMDGDLEDPPEVIPSLIKEWEAGSDVVYAVKTARKDSFLKKLLIKFFYLGMGWFGTVKIDHQSGMFSLLSGKVIAHLKKCRERHKYYVGLRSYLGFKQKKVYFAREERHSGNPRQTFRKLFNYALDAFFAFSFFPIRVLTYFGCFIIFCSACSIFFIVINKLFLNVFSSAVPGYFSLVALILLILGVQIIFMGILGEYLARTFDEVRNRPYYVIAEISDKRDTARKKRLKRERTKKL